MPLYNHAYTFYLAFDSLTGVLFRQIRDGRARDGGTVVPDSVDKILLLAHELDGLRSELLRKQLARRGREKRCVHAHATFFGKGRRHPVLSRSQ